MSEILSITPGQNEFEQKSTQMIVSKVMLVLGLLVFCISLFYQFNSVQFATAKSLTLTSIHDAWMTWAIEKSPNGSTNAHVFIEPVNYNSTYNAVTNKGSAWAAHLVYQNVDLNTANQLSELVKNDWTSIDAGTDTAGQLDILNLQTIQPERNMHQFYDLIAAHGALGLDGFNLLTRFLIPICALMMSFVILLSRTSKKTTRFLSFGAVIVSNALPWLALIISSQSNSLFQALIATAT